MTRQKISVLVPSGNRIDTLEDCLQSLQWADEILVVDSFSTDGSFELAQKLASKVLQHEYGFSALQKNWIIPQAAHEWVLLVDTDERVSEMLKQEILSILEQNPPQAGYRIARVNYLFGQKVSHAGYFPDYQVRLFRRDLAKYELRQVHAHMLLDGECGTLQAPLVHYAHRSLDQTLQNLLIQMTSWEAEERAKKPIKFLALQVLIRPLAAFNLRYFWQGGWRDGFYGLAVSLIWSMYVCITYLKIWESGLKLKTNWWHSHWQNPKVQKDGG